MDKPQQEINAQVDQMEAMLPGVAKMLQEQYPGIILGVDVGIKISDGQLANTLAFRIHVKAKKSEGELSSNERLPKEIKGYPTDVLIYETAQTENYLTGGISLSGAGGSGTLGCFVTLNSEPANNKQAYILSNHHVLLGRNGSIGDTAGHPDRCAGSPCCDCWVVGNVTAGQAGAPGSAGNLIDAAIARLKNQGGGKTADPFFSNTIEEIGPIFGSTTVQVNEIVRKRGNTTNLTYGIVTSRTFPVGVGFSDETLAAAGYINQIRIHPVAPSNDWSQGGDSGSAVVNRFNQVVGLHFSGPKDAPEGNANRIENVTAPGALNISIMSSGTAGALPLSGYPTVQDIPRIKPQSFFESIKHSLGQTESGIMLLDTFRENSGEVMDLVNDNREVTVAWHRYQGPSWLGHLLKQSRERQHKIPENINGYTLHNLMLKMSEVLERQGSNRLAKAVDDYALVLFDFANTLQKENDFDKALQVLENCPVCGKPKQQRNA